MGHLGMSHFRKKEGVFRGAVTGVRCVLGHTHAPAHVRSRIHDGAHRATLANGSRALSLDSEIGPAGPTLCRIYGAKWSKSRISKGVGTILDLCRSTPRQSQAISSWHQKFGKK